MADASPPRRSRAPLPLPDCVALVLQGGGALGSYQAGVIEGLAAVAIEIDWVAGISIGAINAALVAGSPPRAPGKSVAQLLEQAQRRNAELPDRRQSLLPRGIARNVGSDGRAIGSAGLLPPAHGVTFARAPRFDRRNELL